jgi:hypothetical protein
VDGFRAPGIRQAEAEPGGVGGLPLSHASSMVQREDKFVTNGRERRNRVFRGCSGTASMILSIRHRGLFVSRTRHEATVFVPLRRAMAPPSVSKL